MSTYYLTPPLQLEFRAQLFPSLSIKEQFSSGRGGFYHHAWSIPGGCCGCKQTKLRSNVGGFLGHDRHDIHTCYFRRCRGHEVPFAEIGHRIDHVQLRYGSQATGIPSCSGPLRDLGTAERRGGLSAPSSDACWMCSPLYKFDPCRLGAGAATFLFQSPEFVLSPHALR